MKIKDLPKEASLKGVKVITPSGQEGYWAGQWQKGVWLAHNENLNGKIEPVFIESLEDCLEWEVIENETSDN